MRPRGVRKWPPRAWYNNHPLVLLLALILAAPVLSSTASHAGEVFVVADGFARGFRLLSIKELRFRGTVEQQYDFSCGAASVATLLRFHYDRPTTEGEVFSEMWATGERETIMQVGFSLLDMKNFLRVHGYAADGFRISLDDLQEASIPAIALVIVDGYRHFVVIKGISDTEVLIGDSALGVRLVPRDQFEEIRDDILLVVRSHTEVAKRFFNTEEDWKLRPRPPVQVAVGRPELGTFSMLLPSYNTF